LPLLRRKPGALINSLALKQAKQNGKWPKIYDQYRQALNKQYGAENVYGKYGRGTIPDITNSTFDRL
jgi:hypothetical protein